jgi:hypothetical protein
MFRNERTTRLYLSGHDAACPGCGYNLRGLKRLRCPECGREIGWQDIKAPETHIDGTTAAFDLAGLGATVVVNAILAGATAVAVLVYHKGSWFTDDLWNLPRGPESISGVLLIVLGGSLVGWGAAWELSSMTSYRVQKAVAVWCWVLTGFHGVGAVSVMV